MIYWVFRQDFDGIGERVSRISKVDPLVHVLEKTLRKPCLSGGNTTVETLGIIEMTREYPRELRWRVIYLAREGRSTKNIARTLHVGESFVKKIKKIFEDNRSVEYIPRPTNIRNLAAQDILMIKNIVTQYPEVYVDELKDWLQYLTGRIFSLTAIKRCLQKMGYSRRKLNLIARQRNDWQRAEFRHRMAKFDTHQLLFIDESSKDERTFQRRYARGLKGSRISTKGNFTRGTRYSVLSAISVEGVIASHTIVGAYDQRQYEFAMTSFVLPHVGSVARRGKCSVVIMDNCAIHTSIDVITAVRNRGGIVIFLPPYSPDVNPIEEAFGCGKIWLRRHTDICLKYPRWCFELALQQLTAQQCKGFFEDCGYF